MSAAQRGHRSGRRRSAWTHRCSGPPRWPSRRVLADPASVLDLAAPSMPLGPVACCPHVGAFQGLLAGRHPRAGRQPAAQARHQPRRRHARRHPRRRCRRAGVLPAGRAAHRHARDHGLRLHRPDRRGDGPQVGHARRRSASFWDSTLDRIGDAAIFGGLALYFAGPGDSYLYLCLSLFCLVAGHADSATPGRRPSRSASTPRAASPSAPTGWCDPGDDRAQRAARPARSCSR